MDTELVEIAEAIHRRRMTVPAIFMLELHKPLATTLAVGADFLSPLAGPLIGMSRLRSLQGILESRERIEALITLLEERSVKERAR